MNFIKVNPNISLEDFLEICSSVTDFSSLRGRQYFIHNRYGSIISFERLSTGKIWQMDLKDIHKAYLELNDFKTSNFKPYLKRTHSPGLGLLLSLKLLK